jgi:hypothetical protein
MIRYCRDSSDHWFMAHSIRQECRRTKAHKPLDRRCAAVRRLLLLKSCNTTEGKQRHVAAQPAPTRKLSRLGHEPRLGNLPSHLAALLSYMSALQRCIIPCTHVYAATGTSAEQARAVAVLAHRNTAQEIHHGADEIALDALQSINSLVLLHSPPWL